MIWEYQATLVRVVDGDTVDLRIDLGFRTYIQIRARLLGVDTPEVYGVKHSSEEYAQGKLASAFTEKWFEKQGEVVRVVSHKGTGKYGWWLVEITPTEPEEGERYLSLNQVLLEAGHASPVE